MSATLRRLTFVVFQRRFQSSRHLFQHAVRRSPKFSSRSGEPFRRFSGIMGMTMSSPQFDGPLIRAAQNGDQPAFHALAQSYAGPLLRCALALCRDRQLAEDIVQETLLEAWRSLKRFDGRCRFSTWLYGIMRHRYLKAMRRLSRVDLASVPLDALRSPRQSSDDPSHDCQRSEDASQIREAVAALPDEHRQVLELRFFADAALDDIAAALDIPLGTVKSRLHHGLEKLRQQKIALNLFATSGESPTGQP